MDKDEKLKSNADEIPKEVREEFELPEILGMIEVNFTKIRRHDVSFKKQK